MLSGFPTLHVWDHNSIIFSFTIHKMKKKKENKIETSECYKLFPFVELIMEDLK